MFSGSLKLFRSIQDHATGQLYKIKAIKLELPLAFHDKYMCMIYNVCLFIFVVVSSKISEANVL